MIDMEIKINCNDTVIEYTKGLLPLIFPELFASKVVPVQPMTAPAGLIYSLKYVNDKQNEPKRKSI